MPWWIMRQKMLFKNMRTFFNLLSVFGHPCLSVDVVEKVGNNTSSPSYYSNGVQFAYVADNLQVSISKKIVIRGKSGGEHTKTKKTEIDTEPKSVVEFQLLLLVFFFKFGRKAC